MNDYTTAAAVIRWARSRDGYCHHRSTVDGHGITEHTWNTTDATVWATYRYGAFTSGGATRGDLHIDISGDLTTGRFIDLLAAAGVIPVEHSLIYQAGIGAGTLDLATQIAAARRAYDLYDPPVWP
jgi:hypothetical protein